MELKRFLLLLEVLKLLLMVQLLVEMARQEAIPTAAKRGLGPFGGVSTVRERGGMELWGGVVGGLMIRCFRDEGMDQEGSGCKVDFRSWSSRLLKSISFSNFSRSGLKDLILDGVAVLGAFWVDIWVSQNWQILHKIVRG